MTSFDGAVKLARTNFSLGFFHCGPMSQLFTKEISNSAGQVDSVPDFGSRSPGCRTRWRQNLAQDCLVLQCTEFSIITHRLES